MVDTIGDHRWRGRLDQAEAMYGCETCGLGGGADGNPFAGDRRAVYHHHGDDAALHRAGVGTGVGIVRRLFEPLQSAAMAGADPMQKNGRAVDYSCKQKPISCCQYTKKIVKSTSGCVQLRAPLR